MALGDFFQAFNPMDVVKGYEYGEERFRERERSAEEIRRARLANLIIEEQNVPAARLAGAQTGVQLEALETRRPEQERAARQRLAAGESMVQRGLAGEQMLFETAPQRLAQERERRLAGTTPEVTEQLIRVDEDVRGGTEAQARSARLGFGGAVQQQEAMQDFQTTLDAINQEERDALKADPTAQRSDDWAKLDTAIDRTQNRATRRMFQQQRDVQAVRSLTGAAVNHDAPTMNLFLQRYGRSQEVGLVEVDTPQGKIFQWQLYDVQPAVDQATGEQTTQRVPVTGMRFGADPNRPNEWIGTRLPQLLGLSGPAQPRGRAAAAPRPAAPARAAPAVKPTPMTTDEATRRATSGAAPTPAAEGPKPAAAGSPTEQARLAARLQNLTVEEKAQADALNTTLKGLPNTPAMSVVRQTLLDRLKALYSGPAPAPRSGGVAIPGGYGGR